MKNYQKGFADPVTIGIVAFVVVVVIMFGYYIMPKQSQIIDNKVETPTNIANNVPTTTNSVVCTSNWQCGWSVCNADNTQVQVPMDYNSCPTSDILNSRAKANITCSGERKCVSDTSNGIIILSIQSNDLVKLPITLTGYLDGNGWAANEGEIGTVEVFDSTGKSISSREVIRTTTDWLKFPTYFSVMVGDRQMMSYINTDTGYVKITGNGAKDGEQLKSVTIPIRFDKGNTSTEMMDLSIYIQDKSYVETSSCSITKKVVYKVPKTSAVADASLKILFSDELSWYGKYKSVTIVNGVAKVVVEELSGALASCQSSHLFAVVKDTLTQYNSIKSVELVRPNGSVIQF